MSKVICEREDIVAIADAVRSKGNTTEEMTLGEIETAVYNIKSASPTQEKTVDITANGTVEVTPDEGHALSKVTANVNVPQEGVDKIQRWIDLNQDGGGSSAYYLFYHFKGASVDELLDGVDTSNVIRMDSMFNGCSNLTTIPLFNTRRVTIMNGLFNGCSNLTTIPLFNTTRVTDVASMFYGCQELTTIPALDFRNVGSYYNFAYNCKKLTECWIRNIKWNCQIAYGTSYGHLLTLESLLHLCKECRKTTSSNTLTVGTANLAKLEGIYAKLIDITDDMRAEDDLIDEKYPFVQCESTDDGAMTIQDYMALKLWTLK